jgi:hypothetical protein
MPKKHFKSHTVGRKPDGGTDKNSSRNGIVERRLFRPFKSMSCMSVLASYAFQN